MKLQEFCLFHFAVFMTGTRPPRYQLFVTQPLETLSPRCNDHRTFLIVCSCFIYLFFFVAYCFVHTNKDPSMNNNRNRSLKDSMLDTHNNNICISSQTDDLCESERGMWWTYLQRHRFPLKERAAGLLHCADTQIAQNVTHQVEEM